MAVERILGTETGKSAFEKTDRNVVALDASLTADKLDLATHKAENASQVKLGHIKLPGEWFTPTLIGGWSSGSRALQLRKNDFGIVTFKGNIIGGATDLDAFIVPAQYCPLQTTPLILRAGILDIASGYILTNGNARIQSTISGQNINFDNIYYSTF